ncbi:MAG: BTAD domain-containing putative transcriptional regulator [Longimicrobiales bacterium]
MLLRTFGGLTIEAGPGEGSAPSPGRRRLALLALLAASGPRGITREKILGILWPETDEEQARHTLSQTLYLLRRETGREWVSGTILLRLHDSIASDVGQFQDALGANRLENAAELYTGTFLEGFYLAGAAEFERWVEETRSRLRFAAIKTLETLARQAVERGNFVAAAAWWQRLCELDPFSATYATGRIRTLIALGDASAALRYAQEHELHVRRELGTEPDPAIGELITGLQSPRVLGAARNDTALRPAIKDIPNVTKRSAHRSWVMPAALGALLATTVVVTAIVASNSSREAVPFIAVGSIQSQDTALLVPALRDLLATNLARVRGIQVVANSRLLELLPRNARTTPAPMADAARRAGANEIIEGELAIASGGLVLTLRRVALPSGVVRQGYTLHGADAYALTDSATAVIAGDLGLDPPPNAVATVRTRSAIAYALYEQGLRAKYQGDGPATYRLMMAALERDSTFAMAAFHAWSYGRPEESAQLLPLVRRLAERAVDRERLIIQVSLAEGRAPLGQHLGSARELSHRYPDDPDAQFLLGTALWGAGDWANAVSAYNRAVAIDSMAGAIHGTYCRVCGALYTMSLVYLWWDSAAAAERTTRRLLALRPDHSGGWEAAIEPLLRQGRRAEAEAALVRAAKLNAAQVSKDWLLDRDLIRSGRLPELEARIISELRSAAPGAHGENPWLLAFVLRNQGRLRDAENLSLHGVVPGIGKRLAGYRDNAQLAIIALERGDARESARRFLAMVADYRVSQIEPGIKARNITWHMTLAGTALAAAGDTAAVRALADSVERIGANSSFGRDPKLHFFLRGLLLQREQRHAEALDAFRRSLYSATDGYTRTNLEMARSLMALRRYPEAVAILQPALRGGVDGSNTYVTHTELQEALARVFEAAGQRDSAAVHYAAVERAWRSADPQFSERYRSAKARAAPAN